MFCVWYGHTHTLLLSSLGVAFPAWLLTPAYIAVSGYFKGVRTCNEDIVLSLIVTKLRLDFY